MGRRVFEKCGFASEKFVPNVLEVPGSKPGVVGTKVRQGIMR